MTHIKRRTKLIVSLTSHPGRINLVEHTIDSLLRQSLRPDYVVLWLAECQFPRKERSLPKSLRYYTKHGLQIRWCEDIRPYKKLIPTLREFPDDIIVTADDDIIYWENWLEKLYASHIKYPDTILGHHVFMHKYERSTIVSLGLKERSGLLEGLDEFASGGGILFPPHSLYADVLNVELFMALSPSTCDWWFRAMAKLQNTTMMLIDNYEENLVCSEESQACGLGIQLIHKMQLADSLIILSTTMLN